MELRVSQLSDRALKPLLPHTLRIIHKLCSVLHFEESLMLQRQLPKRQLLWEIALFLSSLKFLIQKQLWALKFEHWSDESTAGEQECALWKCSVLLPTLDMEKQENLHCLLLAFWSIIRMSGFSVTFLTIKRPVNKILVIKPYNERGPSSDFSLFFFLVVSHNICCAYWL